ncbi:hypothetical protein Goshw_000177 [Gossypium schwendimanii]|uniref:VQ domain-containing protein n=3 Tax=Gossypium TaxID=3633 RepID=A0A7J9MSD9_GOSSC|nr:hypothetical protein [Gossypium aridum]MBA0873279.1 hypothetical protein [Gossypium schwendimanii]
MGKLRDDHCDKSKKPKKIPVKVKYISSPMMVKASNAEEFRAIVQELTGQHSDMGEPVNVVTTNTKAKLDDRNLLDAYPDDMSSMELFDEGFVWRGVAENLFGFQSPFVFE